MKLLKLELVNKVSTKCVAEKNQKRAHVLFNYNIF